MKINVSVDSVGQLFLIFLRNARLYTDPQVREALEILTGFLSFNRTVVCYAVTFTVKNSAFLIKISKLHIPKLNYIKK